MELRQLRYFVEVARELSFTRAAGSLHVAQPAVSQQLRRLEGELGVRLLHRSSRRVALTDAGAALLPHAETILQAVELARMELQEYAGAVRGRVVVGTIQSLGPLDLPRLLGRFREQYPEVDIVVHEDLSSTMLAMLAGGELDLAIAHVEPGDLRPPLVADSLFDDELVLVAGPGDPLADRPAVPLRVLADVPFISFKPTSGIRQLLDRMMSREGVVLHSAFESGDLATIRSLASQRLGVAVMPRYVAEQDGPPVRLVPFRPPVLRRHISLVRCDAAARSPAVRAFTSFMQQHAPPAPSA